MRIGIFADTSGTIDDIVGRAQEAERDGFQSFWVSHIFGPDALTALAVIGQKTSRIELGTSVVPVYGRHPHAFAQQALTTQAASGGRLTLGIGLSHQVVVENMWGLSYEKPAVHMREYLSVLIPLLHGEPVSYSGEIFRVNAGLQIPVTKPPGLVLAALAPAMLRMAGERADGTVTWMTGIKAIETHIAPRLNAAAEAAGRPRGRICVGLPIAVTDDPTGARERAAQMFQMYGQLPNYQRVLAKAGVKSPGDVAIVGSEAEVEEQLRALAKAGATDFLAVHFPADPDAIERTSALLKRLVGSI
ncbi:MAG: LLM class F420-dependent oxidoreductase [Dehalococcoidia bacterium]